MVLRNIDDIWYDFDDARRGILVYKLYDDIIWWWDVMRTRWWLRSTMGSYGRTCDRGCIWGDYDSLHRGCLRDVSLGRMVGVSSWYITHGQHTRDNTSVGTIYDIFWFSWYKNLYVLCFKKIICIIKREHWWSLTMSWSDDV